MNVIKPHCLQKLLLVVQCLLVGIAIYLFLTSERSVVIWSLYTVAFFLAFMNTPKTPKRVKSVQPDERHRARLLRNGRRYSIVLLFSLASLLPATAQIHQEGQTTIELSGGLMDGFKLPGQDNFGTFGSFSYGKYKTLNSYWKGTVHLNQKFYAYDKTMVPVSQWLGEATYFTRVMGLINKSWVINAGGGLAGGYESINQDRGEIKGASIMNQSQWVFGPTLAIEGEYILTGRTILIARVQEYYLFRSNIIPTHFNLGVGVKFILDTDSDYK